MNKKNIIFIFAALFFAAHCAFSGCASAVITMTLDRNSLDFRTMNPGDTMELTDQGVYENEVTCSSTNNQTWYLKAHLIRPFTSGMNIIPPENFKWMVVSTGEGKGIVTNNINIATPFTTTPGVIYTSDSVDNTGTPIGIKFRYILTIPKNQIAGAYDASVRFTMNEIL